MSRQYKCRLASLQDNQRIGEVVPADDIHILPLFLLLRTSFYFFFTHRDSFQRLVELLPRKVVPLRASQYMSRALPASIMPND